MRQKFDLIDRFLNNDTQIEWLDLSLMELADKDFEDIFEGIKHNTHVTKVNLLQTGIREKHLQPLHDAIVLNKTIVELKLQLFKDYSTSARDLIENMMQHVKHNQELNLSKSSSNTHSYNKF